MGQQTSVTKPREPAPDDNILTNQRGWEPICTAQSSPEPHTVAPYCFPQLPSMSLEPKSKLAKASGTLFYHVLDGSESALKRFSLRFVSHLHELMFIPSNGRKWALVGSRQRLSSDGWGHAVHGVQVTRLRSLGHMAHVGPALPPRPVPFQWHREAGTLSFSFWEELLTLFAQESARDCEVRAL